MPIKSVTTFTDTCSLVEGSFVFQGPTSISKESYGYLETWLGLQLRKAKRLIKKEPIEKVFMAGDGI